MNILRTVWGLFFDDVRLAVTLLLALAAAALASYWGLAWAGTVLVWLGLLLSLYLSIEHQLRRKLASLRRRSGDSESLEGSKL